MDKIEKIRQEIKRLKSTNPSEYNYQNAEGYTWALDDLLSFIDTLSEGPASKGYDEAYLNEKIAKASKTWEGVDVDKYMDEIRGREPDKSLEEAANNYLDGVYGKIPHSDYHIAIFIAGAKWKEGQFEKNRLAACEKQTKEEYDREMEFAVSIIEKEHRQPTFSDAINYGIEWQKKQIPMPEDTVIFNKGIEEGKRLMMEEAVEVSYKGGTAMVNGVEKPFDGGNVRIIIVNE